MRHYLVTNISITAAGCAPDQPLKETTMYVANVAQTAVFTAMVKKRQQY
jgi:hypothetical protein